MGMRTVVEFNHDYGHAIESDPEKFLGLILSMINGGSDSQLIGELKMFGVTVTPTHHHSVPTTVQIEDYYTKEF